MAIRWRLKDGKIIEHQALFDTAFMLAANRIALMSRVRQRIERRLQPDVKQKPPLETYNRGERQHDHAGHAAQVAAAGHCLLEI